jgi:hypothetical protein
MKLELDGVLTYVSFHEHHIYLQAQHVLVQTARKVSIQQETIGNSFTHYSSNETEVTQMVQVYTAVLIWLERTTVLGRCEESVIRIEDFFGENAEELS